MTGLAIASAGISALGSIVQARGTLAAGKAQAAQVAEQGRVNQQAREFEAAQLDVASKEERAAAQVEAGEFKRGKELALSTLQARAAAGGFTATDSTALDLAGEIAARGTFQEQLALFGGTARVSKLSRQAQAARFTGQSGLRAGIIEAGAIRRGAKSAATATILGGIGKFASSAGKAAAGAG